MSNPWLAILNNLPLSRTEREVVRRFEQDPTGRSFLPVADILRAHRLGDESLELLSHGVTSHPGFTVARVVLARELLHKGLVEQAWRTLEESTVPLKDNLLAQKLRFKLALLLGREDVARETSSQLEQQQTLDADSRRLAETLKAYGLAEARQKLINEFEERGTHLSLPPPLPSRDERASSEPVARSGGAVHPIASNAVEASRPGGAALSGDAATRILADAQALERLASDVLQGADWDDQGLGGFHVVPLAEIFRPDDSADTHPHGHGEGPGIELDSTTLADIYARQGHYTKAISVYRRLLQMTPGNELLRRKLAELLQLEKERQDFELTVDPTLVDRLETIEIIDRQMRLLSGLLAKLT